MTTTTYKLLYFNVKVRAEVSRFLFAAAGVPYEDCRITQEEWPAMKQDMPFDQVPVLEVDGKGVLCQSHAIERYLARQFDLAGQDSLEQAKVDMLVCCLEDMISEVLPILKEKDEDKKKEMRSRLEEEVLPRYFSNFTDQIPSGDEYFVGNQLSLADLELAVFVDVAAATGASVPFDKFPRIKVIVDNVESHAGIAEYIRKRPKTPV